MSAHELPDEYPGEAEYSPVLETPEQPLLQPGQVVSCLRALPYDVAITYVNNVLAHSDVGLQPSEERLLGPTLERQPQAEIAQNLGIQPQTVRGELSHGMRKFVACLQPEDHTALVAAAEAARADGEQLIAHLIRITPPMRAVLISELLAVSGSFPSKYREAVQRRLVDRETQDAIATSRGVSNETVEEWENNGLYELTRYATPEFINRVEHTRAWEQWAESQNPALVRNLLHHLPHNECEALVQEALQTGYIALEDQYEQIILHRFKKDYETHTQVAERVRWSSTWVNEHEPRAITALLPFFNEAFLERVEMLHAPPTEHPPSWQELESLLLAAAPNVRKFVLENLSAKSNKMSRRMHHITCDRFLYGLSSKEIAEDHELKKVKYAYEETYRTFTRHKEVISDMDIAMLQANVDMPGGTVQYAPMPLETHFERILVRLGLDPEDEDYVVYRMVSGLEPTMAATMSQQGYMGQQRLERLIARLRVEHGAA